MKYVHKIGENLPLSDQYALVSDEISRLQYYSPLVNILKFIRSPEQQEDTFWWNMCQIRNIRINKWIYFFLLTEKQFDEICGQVAPNFCCLSNVVRLAEEVDMKERKWWPCPVGSSICHEQTGKPMHFSTLWCGSTASYNIIRLLKLRLSCTKMIYTATSSHGLHASITGELRSRLPGQKHVNDADGL